MLYACDATWWNQYAGVPHFEGLKYTQDDCALVYPTVTYIKSKVAAGLSFDRSIIHQGSNSGYQAINLAVHFGATRIILLGYDMQNGPEGQIHHHGDHPKGLNNPSGGLFTAWLENYVTMVPDLKRAGIDVINCTPGSALKCFPAAKLEEVL